MSTTYEKVLDERTGIQIEPGRDLELSEFSRQTHEGYYLRPGETVQLGYARTAKCWSAGDDALAQRIYDYAARGWFGFASPVYSNAVLPGEKIKNLPISCYLGYVGDTIDDLLEHTSEIRRLTVLGGGIGGHWSDVRAESRKSRGIIPHQVGINADMNSYSQGQTRRGSYASYLSVRHPNIREFLSIRLPTGGDSDRRCHGTGYHHAVCLEDEFMEAVEAGGIWALCDPSDGSIREITPARQLWQEILTVRMRTGEPYLFWPDTANRALPEALKSQRLTVNGSNLCAEIMLPTSTTRTAVCCLSSLNADTYDEWKHTNIVADLITFLDNVLQGFIDHAPPALHKAIYSATRERSLGLGLMGFHSYLQSRNVAFESQEARDINIEMFSRIQAEAKAQSYVLGGQRGEAPDMVGTGLRNAHLMAIAPNASSSILISTRPSPSIETSTANGYTHRTRAGSWPVKNRNLEALLESKGLNTAEVWRDIILTKGSVQHLDFLSDHEKAVYKTANEIDQSWVVQHAADRQPFVCQGQSVNLFFAPGATREYVNRVHMEAWQKGLKSLYYVRTSSRHRADAVGKDLERDALPDFVPLKGWQKVKHHAKRHLKRIKDLRLMTPIYFEEKAGAVSVPPVEVSVTEPAKSYAGEAEVFADTCVACSG